MLDYITEEYSCQVNRLFQKMAIKKNDNKKVIKWLEGIGDVQRAEHIKDCAQYIGITNVDGIAKIAKADFCRERLCAVCAWRRQSKFLAQMFPVISILSDKYRFLFATLTIKNMPYDELEAAVNTLLSGYEKLRHRRKIKRSWLGMVRSIELTYNEKDKEFHPHIHLLIAVDKSYFNDTEKYISQNELSLLWSNCIQADYVPICDIRAVNNNVVATVETLKYSLKPTKADEAFKAFYYVLKGRRLISFSGVFAETRNELQLSDFENVLTDDDVKAKTRRVFCELYQFDVTGGVYRFYKSMEMI